ncbi:MAG: hypothetical protein AAFV85_10685 [Cyanobacteria bacterium J06634_6]
MNIGLKLGQFAEPADILKENVKPSALASGAGSFDPGTTVIIPYAKL